MYPQLPNLNLLTFDTIRFDIFLRKEYDNVKSNDKRNLEMVRYTVYQRFLCVRNNLIWRNASQNTKLKRTVNN